MTEPDPNFRLWLERAYDSATRDEIAPSVCHMFVAFSAGKKQGIQEGKAAMLEEVLDKLRRTFSR